MIEERGQGQGKQDTWSSFFELIFLQSNVLTLVNRKCCLIDHLEAPLIGVHHHYARTPHVHQ